MCRSDDNACFRLNIIKINSTCYFVLSKNMVSKKLNLMYVPHIIFLLVRAALENVRDKSQITSTGFRKSSGAAAYPENTAQTSTWSRPTPPASSLWIRKVLKSFYNCGLLLLMMYPRLTPQFHVPPFIS